MSLSRFVEKCGRGEEYAFTVKVKPTTWMRTVSSAGILWAWFLKQHVQQSRTTVRVRSYRKSRLPWAWFQAVVAKKAQTVAKFTYWTTGSRWRWFDTCCAICSRQRFVTMRKMSPLLEKQFIHKREMSDYRILIDYGGICVRWEFNLRNKVSKRVIV